jgi:hypothetical protein
VAVVRGGVHPFTAWSGQSATVLFDSRNALALARATPDDIPGNPRFLDFARFHGFDLHDAEVHRAQTTA